MLRSVEALMFRRAAGGFAPAPAANRASEINALECLVEAYRLLLDSFLRGDASKARMQVALRGRETLVVGRCRLILL